MLREVFAFYDAAARGERSTCRCRVRTASTSSFSAGSISTPPRRTGAAYLAGFTAPTPLVIDRRRDRRRGADRPIQGVSERRLSAETTTALREFAASRGVTLNTLLQAAWALLLHRYSGESDVVFGATRACRRSAFPDADEMVGLFINTLPLRVTVDPDAVASTTCLKDVRAQQVELREHEHTPLAKVQGWSEVPRGRPLFDTILVYEDRTLDATLRTLDAEGSRLAFAYHGQTNYPLTLIAYGDDEMLLRARERPPARRRRAGRADARATS